MDNGSLRGGFRLAKAGASALYGGGMAWTKQKAAIHKVLARAERPLARDEILRRGRELHSRLGTATVDRTIREMTGNFELVAVEFPGQPKRYELPSSSEHPHFICRSCDRVFDLPVAMRLPEIEAPEGFEIRGGEIIYSGLCPRCATGGSGSSAPPPG